MKRILVLATAALWGAAGCKAELDEGAPAPSGTAGRAQAGPADAEGSGGRASPPLTKAEIAALQADSANWKTFLPGPDDVLAALDGLDEQAGAPLRLVKQIEPLGTDAASSKSALALAAGVRVTDFFVYVHAKDARRAQGVAQDLLSLAERLGAARDTQTSGKKVLSALDARDWARVKANMQEVYSGIRTTLEADAEQAELADFVALGAWLESVHLITGQLEADYAEGPARLLRQGFLAQFFAEKLGGHTDPWVRELVAVTTKIQSAMDVQAGGAVPQAGVRTIHEATTRVRDAV